MKRCVDHAEPSAGAERTNPASWRRLKRLLDDLAGESGLRAVVLRGAGDKAFAGCRHQGVSEHPHERRGRRGVQRELRLPSRALTTMPIPVIAAVRGSPSVAAVSWRRPAMRASRPTTRASASRWAKSGVTTGFTEADTVARLIGPAALKYLLFSGELIGIRKPPAGDWCKGRRTTGFGGRDGQTGRLGLP
ncbi:hypothetical protein ACQKB2_18115 [Mycobacterium tuberculosis]